MTWSDNVGASVADQEEEVGVLARREGSRLLAESCVENHLLKEVSREGRSSNRGSG